MALEKKEKLTLLQRLRILILGRERPNLATRISVSIGFGFWVFLVSWHVLTLMSITLMGSLDQEDLIRGAFQRVGSKMYDFTDTVERLTFYTIVELGLYGFALIGLILIYRRKKLGFLFYVFSNLMIVIMTILIMGLKYFQYEWTYTDLLLLGIPTIYFGIGALWFYRIKPGRKKEVENTFQEASE